MAPFILINKLMHDFEFKAAFLRLNPKKCRKLSKIKKIK
jgi:hypothetical protein